MINVPLPPFPLSPPSLHPPFPAPLPSIPPSLQPLTSGAPLPTSRWILK
ncbi:MAG: hypothetical protein MJE68_14375 [Proteobacteria bacterium]|nr:hypothetical protein [Pseudomonadota bacterium]